MTRSRLLGWIVAGALVMIALAAALLLFQAGWVGHASVSEATRRPAVVAKRSEGRRAAILRSEATAQFLRSGAAYEAHPQYWQSLLQNAGWTADIISDAQLQQDLSPYAVLVLPSSVCLSDGQKNAIRMFLRSGKGVVATWITGTRDAAGKWIGWQFLQELTHADNLEISVRPAPWFVAFAAGSPLTTGLPSGSRIQVVSPERAVATALHVDGYWSDYRLFPVDEKLPPNFLGSVVSSEFEGRGRVAWLGFQENSAVAAGPDKAIFDAVLLNAVSWSSREFLAAVGAWPAPYSSAVLLALSVEDLPENANYAADALLRNEARATFYCAPEAVRGNTSLLQNLRRAGEVASHGWQQIPLERLNKYQVIYGLIASRWVLQRESGQHVSGFFPPYEAMPTPVISSVAAARYRHFLSGAEGNSALPQMLTVSQDWGPLHRHRRLVRFIRMGEDDLSLTPLGVTGLDQDWIVQRITSDADIIDSLGGLYVLSFHTQGLSAPEYVPALSQLVKNWKSNSVWVTTADDLANWWIKRADVNIELTASGNTPTLKLEYTGKEPISGLTVDIYSPEHPAKLMLLPSRADLPVPSFQVDAEHNRLQVRFERLLRGTYWYELRSQAAANASP